MTQPIADVLERSAGDLHAVAFDYREPRRSASHVDCLIDEVERICAAARAGGETAADLAGRSSLGRWR